MDWHLFRAHHQLECDAEDCAATSPFSAAAAAEQRGCQDLCAMPVSELRVDGGHLNVMANTNK